MSAEGNISRILYKEGGVLFIANEVTSDSPLIFRSIVAVNTNLEPVSIKIGNLNTGFTGGWVKRIDLSQVGVKGELPLYIRCATTDFTYRGKLDVTPALEEGNLVFIKLR